MFVDYDYYKTDYGGEKATEENFKRFEMQARTVLNYYTFDRIEEATEEVKMALCELIDKMIDYSANDGREIKSETVGSFSRTFKDNPMSEMASYQKIIKLYLGHTGLMYRGKSKKPIQGPGDVYEY